MARVARPAAVPRQARGEARVAAILEAAAALFEERGVDAVTMSEVASRSATAVGSLYRFFPTKEALIAGLLERYAGETFTRLDTLRERASAMSAHELAGALVRLVRDLAAVRRTSLALLTTRPGASASGWDAFLAAFRERLEALAYARAGRGSEAPGVAGAVCLTLLGGVARSLKQDAEIAERLVAVHEGLLVHWLATCAGGGHASSVACRAEHAPSSSSQSR